MRAVLLVLLVAACGDSGAPAMTDAAIKDAAMPDVGGPPQNDITMCSPVGAVASCTAGTVAVRTQFAGGSTSHTLCGAQVDATATCTGGCAVSAAMRFSAPAEQVVAVTGTPEVLCTETAPATVGTVCRRAFFPTNTTGVSAAVHYDIPCLPTHAELASDGTVIGQTYLTCDTQTQRCKAVLAPVIAGYLEACDAAVVTQYGADGVAGVVASDSTIYPYPADACLLAWDAAAQATASGKTIQCIGDWQCPAGALCDDAIPRVAGTTGPAVAVCKPGPRGTLTPAMLAP